VHAPFSLLIFAFRPNWLMALRREDCGADLYSCKWINIACARCAKFLALLEGCVCVQQWCFPFAYIDRSLARIWPKISLSYCAQCHISISAPKNYVPSATSCFGGQERVARVGTSGNLFRGSAGEWNLCEVEGTGKIVRIFICFNSFIVILTAVRSSQQF